MKNLKLLIAILFTSVSAFASGEKSVKEQFVSDYANAKNEVWGKSGDYYLVDFEVENMRTKAIYSEDGKLLRLLQYTSFDQLPLSMRTKINSIIGKKQNVLNVTIVSNLDESIYYVRTEDEKNMYLYKVDVYGYYERIEKFKKAN